MSDDNRLQALHIASSQVRADIEHELSKLGEDVGDDNEQLHDALASIKTVEALFSWLLGTYSPRPGTLLAALQAKLGQTQAPRERDAEFTLNPEAFDAWERPFDWCDDEDVPTWDPKLHGNESDILVLVQEAQSRGVIVAPAGAEVRYCYADDEDGGGYLWTVALERPDPGGGVSVRLTLASYWEEQRKIVYDEAVGREAMRRILQEAVDVANRLLEDLERWTRLDTR